MNACLIYNALSMSEKEILCVIEKNNILIELNNLKEIFPLKDVYESSV